MKSLRGLVLVVGLALGGCVAPLVTFEEVDSLEQELYGGEGTGTLADAAPEPVDPNNPTGAQPGDPDCPDDPEDALDENGRYNYPQPDPLNPDQGDLEIFPNADPLVIYEEGEAEEFGGDPIDDGLGTGSGPLPDEEPLPPAEPEPTLGEPVD